jgi:hypothetical protein
MAGCAAASQPLKDLELPQAALRHRHGEHHPIIIPKIVKPKRQPPRQRC